MEITGMCEEITTHRPDGLSRLSVLISVGRSATPEFDVLVNEIIKYLKSFYMEVERIV
jgi:hypothetical protein